MYKSFLYSPVKQQFTIINRINLFIQWEPENCGLQKLFLDSRILNNLLNELETQKICSVHYAQTQRFFSYE